MKIDHLPYSLFSSQQVRDIDYSAINKHHINGYELMTKAAEFSFQTLLRRFENAKQVITLCGSGNNAGDGYIVAGLAKNAGLESKVYYLSSPSKLKGDAQLAHEFAVKNNVRIEPFSDSLELADLTRNTIIVDALLGTGLNSEVRGEYRNAIELVNKSALPILAIDIPSGLCANTGMVLGIAVEAAATATFIGLKFGLLTGEGQSYCGDVYFDQLDVPDPVLNEQTPIAQLPKINALLSTIPKRTQHSHKGSFGHTLIIGGDSGYGGAAILSSEAALYGGSGLTSLITHPNHIAASLSRHPEVMVSSSLDLNKSLSLIEQASVIVIGPGLGQGAWGERMLQEVLPLDKPVIIDADALNIIAQKPHWVKKVSDYGNQRIITPHPGEAARLLNCTTKEIQSNRLAALNALASKLNCNVLLKGSGSLVSSLDHGISVCGYGNPGMACGGMGDVLAGLIGALLAQNLPPSEALLLGVLVHSYAADRLAQEQGEIGLTASAVAKTIRQIVNRKAV